MTSPPSLPKPQRVCEFGVVHRLHEQFPLHPADVLKSGESNLLRLVEKAGGDTGDCQRTEYGRSGPVGLTHIR